MKERVLGRAAESEIKRADDNVEAFEKRVRVFLDETGEVLRVFGG